MPLVSFLMSIPTFAVFLPGGFFTAIGCNGGFIDSAAKCSDPGFMPLYNLITDLVFAAILLAVVVVPLVLILSTLSIMRLSKETVHDAFWWARVTMSLLAAVAQAEIIRIFLSRL